MRTHARAFNQRTKVVGSDGIGKRSRSVHLDKRIVSTGNEIEKEQNRNGMGETNNSVSSFERVDGDEEESGARKREKKLFAVSIAFNLTEQITELSIRMGELKRASSTRLPAI